MSLVAEGPEISVCGWAWVQPPERAGQIGRHLIRADDHQMEVGDEGEGAAALRGPVVEHDRAGLRDRHRAPGDYARQFVELRRRQLGCVPDQRQARGLCARCC